MKPMDVVMCVIWCELKYALVALSLGHMVIQVKHLFSESLHLTIHVCGCPVCVCSLLWQLSLSP